MITMKQTTNVKHDMIYALHHDTTRDEIRKMIVDAKNLPFLHIDARDDMTDNETPIDVTLITFFECRPYDRKYPKHVNALIAFKSSRDIYDYETLHDCRDDLTIAMH